MKHIYINEIKDAELIKRIEQETLKRKRSMAYIVLEKLRKAFDLNGNGGD